MQHWPGGVQLARFLTLAVQRVAPALARVHLTGPARRTDNIMSTPLTIDSPILPASSLMLTVLDGRWLARKSAGYELPGTRQRPSLRTRRAARSQ